MSDRQDTECRRTLSCTGNLGLYCWLHKVDDTTPGELVAAFHEKAELVVDNGGATERDIAILENEHIENKTTTRWKSFKSKEIATPNSEIALKLKRRVASAISGPHSKEARKTAETSAGKGGEICREFYLHGAVGTPARLRRRD